MYSDSLIFQKMETLRKQLELKAVEIVDILEALDVDEKVPEVMRRRRGQDNFDQRMYMCHSSSDPSSHHLFFQHLNPIWQDNAKRCKTCGRKMSVTLQLKVRKKIDLYTISLTV